MPDMSTLVKVDFSTTLFEKIRIICKDKKIYEVIMENREIYNDIPDDRTNCFRFVKIIHNYLEENTPIKIDKSDIYFQRVSDFYRLVYIKTMEVPYGMVSTYKDIAHEIGRPRAYRAVATALKKNPFPIVVPCHRIIRSDGRLGGITSKSIEFRRKLLELEKGEKNGKT